jgi:hypothetical protein
MTRERERHCRLPPPSSESEKWKTIEDKTAEDDSTRSEKNFKMFSIFLPIVYFLPV